MSRVGLPESLIEKLTCRVTPRSTGKTYVVVRPGMGLAFYYSKPLHVMVDSIEKMLEGYLRFIPEGAITALGGAQSWGSFRRVRLQAQIKKLKNRRVDCTNIDLSSGPLLGSEGSYGWHLNGGNLCIPIYPNNTNVFYYEFPPDEIDRVGAEHLIEWAISIAEISPFESGHFGYSFNQLQRTWTSEADAFVGNLAMQYKGFDILEPDLACYARGRVPNCSWLTFLGSELVARLGGEETIRSNLSSAVDIRRIKGGLLLRAGEFPLIGDTNLGALPEVARLTKPLRITEKYVLLYGAEEFYRDGWLHRFDK